MKTQSQIKEMLEEYENRYSKNPSAILLSDIHLLRYILDINQESFGKYKVEEPTHILEVKEEEESEWEKAFFI